MRSRLASGKSADPDDEWDDAGPESPNAGRNVTGRRGRGQDEKFADMGNTTELPAPKGKVYATKREDDMPKEDDDMSEVSEIDIGILS